MSRQTPDNLVAQSIINYDCSMNYMAPELRLYIMSNSRHPGRLIQKMLLLVPKDEKYDKFYNSIATTLYNACCNSRIIEFKDYFWLPMGDDILPQIGELDEPWKQKLIDYWLAKLDYTSA